MCEPECASTEKRESIGEKGIYVEMQLITQGKNQMSSMKHFFKKKKKFNFSTFQ